ncbi:MAG: endopeptidase La [Clostridia bacterium]|nr:endopeptidase La [Clostridia bacterium]
MALRMNMIYRAIPTIALRGMVVFPKMRLDFEVRRQISIDAVKAAMEGNARVFLVTQRDSSQEEPTPDGLCSVGVVATVKQLASPFDGGKLHVIVEGVCRAETVQVRQEGGILLSDVRPRRSLPIPQEDQMRVDALMRSVKVRFGEFMTLTQKKAPEILMQALASYDPAALADFIAGHAINNPEQKQQLLEELNPVRRLELLIDALSWEVGVLQLEDDIDRRVQDAMDDNQRDYYLREQMKVISAELGEDDDGLGEAQQYREKVQALHLDEAAEKKLLKECSRLGKLQNNSPDANVIRSYLDAVLALPWNVRTEDSFDLAAARRILDRDHYGMQKVKDRFLEMLAVRALTDNAHGQILCLVGPPGVGKTSIVRAVAEAMGRKYVRMSLGGVRDEAEIRGHRKTYIGAMPGRIVTGLTNAGSMNPIFLLDEIDKLGADYKGDPSAALLEALDPEQNNAFADHYLEIPLDLSRVLFITTANDSSTIPGPLLDRMEVIELPSYTSEEKFHIAKEHLIKKQIAMHGLNGQKLRFSDAAVRTLIEGYTREAGVRRLEQCIAAVCRKCAVRLADGPMKRITVTPKLLEELLGPQKYRPEDLARTDRVGVVNGLAWTSVGGELLQVEALVMDGTGKLELTGSLGDVMKESAKAAHSYVRSVAPRYGIDKDLFKTKDIHVHVPQGAVPKDGPSAGVTMTTALLSALTGRTVRHDVAMTGEISLTGRVMPIGGLREKSMAAYKNGIRLVLIPKENEPDLWEVEDVVKQNVTFRPVERLDEVLSAALNETQADREPAPQPRRRSPRRTAAREQERTEG